MAVVESGCAVRSMGHMVVQGTVRVRRPGKGQVGISRFMQKEKRRKLAERRKEGVRAVCIRLPARKIQLLLLSVLV